MSQIYKGLNLQVEAHGYHLGSSPMIKKPELKAAKADLAGFWTKYHLTMERGDNSSLASFHCKNATEPRAKA